MRPIERSLGGQCIVLPDRIPSVNQVVNVWRPGVQLTRNQKRLDTLPSEDQVPGKKITVRVSDELYEAVYKYVDEKLGLDDPSAPLRDLYAEMVERPELGDLAKHERMVNALSKRRRITPPHKKRGKR